MMIRRIPVLMVGITLAVATGDASAGNGARNTEARIQSGSGRTALLVEKPAPGGPIGKPLPPVPVDPGKGNGRVGHDRYSSHEDGDRYRYDDRRHRHGRYESPPIIGKHPGYKPRQSDLFERGVVGPIIGPGSGG